MAESYSTTATKTEQLCSTKHLLFVRVPIDPPHHIHAAHSTAPGWGKALVWPQPAVAQVHVQCNLLGVHVQELRARADRVERQDCNYSLSTLFQLNQLPQCYIAHVPQQGFQVFQVACWLQWGFSSGRRFQSGHTALQNAFPCRVTTVVGSAAVLLDHFEMRGDWKQGLLHIAQHCLPAGQSISFDSQLPPWYGTSGKVMLVEVEIKQFEQLKLEKVLWQLIHRHLPPYSHRYPVPVASLATLGIIGFSGRQALELVTAMLARTHLI
eukprot:scaffold58022_cov18-Tisochrysis_lutea.AAC.3